MDATAQDGEKFALVTGCAEGGIGDAIAKELLRRGYDVIATRRSVSSASATAHIPSPHCHWRALDVTSDASVADLAAAVQSLTGSKLHLLIHNAAMPCNRPCVDVPAELATRVFDTNFIGALRVVNALHRSVLATRGTIAVIGSCVAVAPSPFMGLYSASKAALAQYANTLRIELAPFGVSVVHVVGGMIRTKFMETDPNRGVAPDSLYRPLAKEVDELYSDQSRATPPETLAKEVVDALMRKTPPAWLWTGSFTGVLWALSTFFPHTIFDWFYGTMFPLKRLSASTVS